MNSERTVSDTRERRVGMPVEETNICGCTRMPIVI